MIRLIFTLPRKTVFCKPYCTYLLLRSWRGLSFTSPLSSSEERSIDKALFDATDARKQANNRQASEQHQKRGRAGFYLHLSIPLQGSVSL